MVEYNTERAAKRKTKTPKGSLAERVTDPFSGPKSARDKRAATVRQREHDQRLLAAAASAESVRFYNQANAEARTEYWARTEWTFDQAAALSFGKEPDVVNHHSLRDLEPVWEFARTFSERRQLIRRLYHRNGWVLAAPNWVIERSKMLGFAFPETFVEAVQNARQAEFAHRPRETTPQEVEDLRRQIAQLTAERDEAQRLARSAKDALAKEQATNPKGLRSHMALEYALALKTRFTIDGRSGAASTIFKLLEGTPAQLHRDTIHDRLTEAVTRFRVDDSD